LNEKKRIILSFLLMFVILFSFISFTTPVKASDNKFYVWVVTDVHMNRTSTRGGNYSGTTNYDIYTKMLSDSENNWGFDWDIQLILGDLADSADISQYQQFQEAIKVLTKHNREDIYILGGNHDGANEDPDASTHWKEYVDNSGANIDTSGVDNSLRPYTVDNSSNNDASFTITVGNTEFIMWGKTIASSTKNEYDTGWLGNRLNNIDSDNNILLFGHHPISGTPTAYNNYTGTWLSSTRAMDSTDSTYVKNWMSANSGRIDAYFHGHVHCHESPDEDTTNWGQFNGTGYGDCLFMNAGACMEAGYSTCASKSIVLEFTQGSKTVNVYDYYHGISDVDFRLYSQEAQWDGNNIWRGNHTFELNYAFDSVDTRSFEGFVSINNQDNNTVTGEQITRFNWTKNDSTLYYRLQIANDSSFTDIWFNETINATTFPTNYSEKGDYIEFILPDEYRVNWNKNYYFRYRSEEYFTGR